MPGNDRASHNYKRRNKSRIIKKLKKGKPVQNEIPDFSGMTSTSVSKFRQLHKAGAIRNRIGRHARQRPGISQLQAKE